MDDARYVTYQMAEVALHRTLSWEILRRIARLAQTETTIPSTGVTTYGLSRGSGICVRHSGDGAHQPFLIGTFSEQTRVETGENKENSWNERRLQVIINSTDFRSGQKAFHLGNVGLDQSLILGSPIPSQPYRLC